MTGKKNQLIKSAILTKIYFKLNTSFFKQIETTKEFFCSFY